MDHDVLSIGPEAVDLVSERRAVGAPVKDRKRLVELVGGLLSSAPSSQVDRTLLRVRLLRTAALGLLLFFLEVCFVPLGNALVLTINGGKHR